MTRKTIRCDYCEKEFEREVSHVNFNRGCKNPTSGRPLTEREKEYIIRNSSVKLKAQIARELGELFPEDNGGYRSQTTVRNFLKRKGIE